MSWQVVLCGKHYWMTLLKVTLLKQCFTFKRIISLAGLATLRQRVYRKRDLLPRVATWLGVCRGEKDLGLFVLVSVAGRCHSDFAAGAKWPG